MKYLHRFRLFEAGVSGLRAVRLPDRSWVPFGPEVQLGGVKLYYGLGAGALEFRALKGEIVGAKPLAGGDGYLFFAEPGELRVSVVRAGSEVARLETLIGAKEGQVWALSDRARLTGIGLVRIERPAGDWPVVADQHLLVVASDRDRLGFESSAETLPEAAWLGGYYRVPLTSEHCSLTVRARDGSALVPAELGFGGLEPGSLPALRLGEASFWRAEMIEINET